MNKEMFDKPVKEVKDKGDRMLVCFEDGSELELLKEPEKIREEQRPACVFCGKKDNETYLCTLDDKTYVCKDCTSNMMELFCSAGVKVDLNMTSLLNSLTNMIKGVKK